MFIRFDSLPPEAGKVHFTSQAESLLVFAQTLDRSERSRVVSGLADVVTTALLTVCPVDFVNEGTGERIYAAHSLWEGHPVLSHQPDHGAFIAGIHDASNRFHKLYEFAETGATL